MCRFDRLINGARPSSQKGVKEAVLEVSERFMRFTGAIPYGFSLSAIIDRSGPPRS